MTDYVQISAQITEETRRRLDLYARETGIKKSRLIEDAIAQHLTALDDVPQEFIVPARMVVDAETWKRVVDEIENPSEPTAALRELMTRETRNQD